MKISFSTYGHTDPAAPDRPRNSMFVVNWGLWQGVQLAAQRLGAELVDLSPPLGPRGVRRDLHAELPTEPADVFVFQAGVSLHRVEAMLALNPDCICIGQRESTHAKSWLSLMKAAQSKHGIRWQTNYDYPSGMARDLREYELAHRILVPSGFVASTFEEHGLGEKTIYYGPTTFDFWDVNLARHPFRFDVMHAAQLGIRKGTLDVFAAWRQFRKAYPKKSALLHVAGLPEDGAPPELKERLAHEFHTTPDVVRCNWMDRADLRKLYAKCHVLLAPSVEDGATMVGYEGAYAGCCVISTYNAGIDLPRLDVESVDDIAQALGEVATNKQFRNFWARHGHEAAAEQCGLDKYAGRVADAIEEALS